MALVASVGNCCGRWLFVCSEESCRRPSAAGSRPPQETRVSWVDERYYWCDAITSCWVTWCFPKFSSFKCHRKCCVTVSRHLSCPAQYGATLSIAWRLSVYLSCNSINQSINQYIYNTPWYRGACYSADYAEAKRNVLGRILSVLTDGAVQQFRGREFQSLGAATEKRRAAVSKLCGRTDRNFCVDDHNERDWLYGLIRSAR